MTMAQSKLSVREEFSGVQPDVSLSTFNQTHRSHVLVQAAALRGEPERNDSGRMVICDDTDIPDLMDYSEWRGR